MPQAKADEPGTGLPVPEPAHAVARDGGAVNLLTGPLIGVVAAMPRGAARRLGSMMGAAAGLFLRRKTRRIINNLQSAGQADPVVGARRAWRALGTNLMEMLWSLGRRPETVMRSVSVEGVESLLEAQRAGRGVLLVSGHIGNWELVPLAVARAGLKMAVVAREMAAPGLERRMIALREKGGVRTLVRARAGTSVAAYRWLHRGDVLGSMMDRLSAGRRVKVPLLGKATRMPLAPAILACRTGATVVLGCAHRRRDGGCRVEFRRVGGPFQRPEELTAAVAAALDEDLRRHPEEWFWIYRRQPA